MVERKWCFFIWTLCSWCCDSDLLSSHVIYEVIWQYL